MRFLGNTKPAPMANSPQHSERLIGSFGSVHTISTRAPRSQVGESTWGQPGKMGQPLSRILNLGFGMSLALAVRSIPDLGRHMTVGRCGECAS